MNVADVRAALDAALREAATEADPRDTENGHAWGEWSDCASQNEGLYCCLDPSHRNFDRMLDYLADRIARRLP